jgi:transposase
MGYRGAVSTVRHDVRRLEGEAGGTLPWAASTGAVPRVKAPSPRRLAALAVIRPDDRHAEAQQALDTLCARDEAIQEALGLAEGFTAVIRGCDPGALTGWLTRAEEPPVPELRTFARGLRRDGAAVRAGIELPWSNGPVEGHINRLKAIMRSMYGRARFDLLRARALDAGYAPEHQKCGRTNLVQHFSSAITAPNKSLG